MNGTELCCRFSGITNSLNYCGPSDAHRTFARFMQAGEGEREVQELLSRFEGLFPYLQLIAKKHNLQPFDYRVVEAYWLGNELLDAFTVDDFRSFLPELGKRGLPIVRQLQEKVPEGAIPHHTFNVLFVGVGQITGSVPTTLENMQNCMASWGEVISPSAVKGSVLIKNNGYSLSEAERTVRFGLVHPKIGDKVAIHWGECVHILNQQQYENLQKYTEKVIRAVNLISLPQRRTG
ncbi:Uncharacterised protein [uncultured archaeon]|nr:Uncharacterised protein [uncultured archaeon]